MKEAIQSIPEAGRKETVAGSGYEIAETVHTLNRTPHAFRLVVKRELRRQPDLFASEDRYFYHVVGRIIR